MRCLSIWLVAAFAILPPGPAAGRSPAGPYITEHRALNAAGAAAAMAAAKAAARERNLALSIAVVDAGGNLMAYQRMDNAILASIEVAIGKAETAARIMLPTGTYQKILEGGTLAMLSVGTLTPVRGGVPIMRDGEMVGAIGCSGGTAEQDEQIALIGAAVLASQGSASGP